MTTPIDGALACDMTAIPPEERAPHARLGRRLFASAQLTAVDEAPGEGLRAVMDAGAFDDLARWMSYERLCCPFLRFTVELAPDGGAITLTMRGPSGTRAFLESEIL